jgi:hypothetical protein
MARSVHKVARYIKIHTRHNILISKILYPDIPEAPDIITFTATRIKQTKPYKNSTSHKTFHHSPCPAGT